MSPFSLLIGPVLILAAASLLSWWTPSVPLLEPDVHFHDTYYSLRGWSAGLVFRLTLFAGVAIMAVRFKAWSVWVTRAATAVGVSLVFHLFVAAALRYAYANPREYPPFALAEGFHRLVTAVLTSAPTVDSVALLATLSAVLITLQGALQRRGEMAPSESRRMSLATFTLGTALCFAWAYWSVSWVVAQMPPLHSASVAYIRSLGVLYTLANSLPGILPLVMTFELTRDLASGRLASRWRWTYTAVVVALTVVPIADGIFALSILLTNPVHMFFATGALAIWIAKRRVR